MPTQPTAPARPRPRLKFKPQWKGPIEGYTVRFCKKHEWRFHPQADFDDLYQECFLLFMKLCDAYPQVVDPPHFMALYKRAVFNKVTTLAQRASRHPELSLDAELSHDDDAADARHPAAPPDVDAGVELVLQDAPAWVKRVMRRAGRDADGPPARMRRQGYWRETTEAFVRRVGRVPAYISSVTVELQNLVTGEAPCTRSRSQSTSISLTMSAGTPAPA